MPQAFFEIEKGLELNAAVFLAGSGVPGAGGDTAAVGVGSYYLDTADGSLYTKTASGTGTDKWDKQANEDFVNNLTTNLQTEVDAIETSVGLNTDGTFIAHSGTNYIDGGTSFFDVDELLDTAAGNIQSELDTTQTSLGAVVNAAGVYQPFTGTNFLDGNASITEDLTDLDTAIQAAIDGALKIDGSNSMTANLNMGGNRIVNMADGIDPTDAVTKQQLDAAEAGILVKEACELATEDYLDNLAGATVTEAGSGVGKTITTGVAALTVDGVAVADGDRILVKDEADTGASTNLGQEDNGIYVVSGVGVNVVLTRATDFDGNPSGEVKAGNFTFINEGTVNGKTGWVLTDQSIPVPDAVVVDTDPQFWTQFQGLPQFIAGAGLDLTGDTFSVKFGAGITELPTDEVGVDLRAAGGLFTTVDGSTPSTVTGSQLSIRLADSSLVLAAGGISVNPSIQNEIDAIEASLGAIVDASGVYQGFTGTNYMDGNASITEDLTDLDTAIGNNASAIATITGTTIPDLQTEVDNIEAALGSMVDNSGNYVPFSGTNYIDGNSSVAEDLTDLDNQIGLNAGNITSLQSELDATQVGAGLNTDGTYISPTGTNYIDSATSLADADELLDAAIANAGLPQVKETGVTTQTILDAVLVDDVQAVKWLVVAEDAGGDKQAVEVYAIHDGTATSDATTTDYTVYAKLKIGNIVGANLDVVVVGSTTSQEMRLLVESTETTTVRAARISVLE